MNFYYDSPKFGLETVGEIDWSNGIYEFDLTVIWRRTADNQFVYGEDVGCSCPTPFEDQSVDDPTPIASLAELQAHLNQRNNRYNDEGYSDTREDQIVALLDRLHKAGLSVGTP